MPDGVMSNSVVFTSWKEIASYLGKGVRTVQRWEAQFGLPVHRPNAHAKGIVRATREELDQWIATRWSPRSGQFELPDLGVTRAPVRTNLEASQELRMQNRALLLGLHKSLEQLKDTCKDLALNMALNRELGPEGAFAARAGSEITDSQFAPAYSTHKPPKPD